MDGSETRSLNGDAAAGIDGLALRSIVEGGGGVIGDGCGNLVPGHCLCGSDNDVVDRVGLASVGRNGIAAVDGVIASIGGGVSPVLIG